MCPEARRPGAGIERGYSLVPALFLLIVLAGLGTVAVRLGAVQSQTVVLGMQSSRAYAAAQSGIEWAAYRAITGGSCDSASFSFTEAGLDGFSVDTNCSVSTHTEGSSSVRVYAVEAFARFGSYGSPDYVTRRLRATVTDAP